MFLCLLICVLAVTLAELRAEQFPDDFLFGVATSAYQIEGAWNVDGKGPSIWDEYTHTHPERIQNHENADVAANSYDYYLDDIEAIKSLNMQHYRFSIAWSRVLPTGHISNVNEKGIEYYSRLINKLLENDIEPMVTMYHSDLPLNFQSLGGFTNPIMIEYFEAYAKLLFERFGDRVKYWITFNEPHEFCRDDAAANGKYYGVGEYLCAHNTLKAHAVVYHMYRNAYYDKFKGQIGIALNGHFFYPQANDTNASDRAMQFMLGWFAHPIFSANGNYPQTIVEQIATNSKSEGRSYSRLPIFSKQWIDMIRGSADFLGLNYYTSYYAETPEEPSLPNPSHSRDRNVKQIIQSGWKHAASGFLYSVPRGLGDILRWIKKEYNNPNVFITENGWSDFGGLDDNDRTEYLHDHLKEVQNVILKDDCNVKGYTVWSIIDNFEWFDGYTVKFGLFAVNMTSPKRDRTAKKSAKFMAQVTKARQIPDLK